MLDPTRLRGRARWERTMHGWVDNTHDDAVTHTVRLREDARAVEVAVVATPSPEYAIREAGARTLDGQVDPAALDGFARLAGARMVGGLTRRAAEACGDGAGAPLLVDAVIEVARLARQVAKLPRERAERAAAGPLACWELDTTGWIDLPNSCFTYTDAGRALFGTRTVTTPMHPDLYSPRPGQAKVFERRKTLRLERRGGRLVLFHSMHDNAHGFEVTYELDTATGLVVRAEHVTPRLPYAGICTEPQRKIAAMLGETADPGLRKRIQGHLGGASGCAQLYDLTADLLKLLD
jgi:hypothetical protein